MLLIHGALAGMRNSSISQWIHHEGLTLCFTTELHLNPTWPGLELDSRVRVWFIDKNRVGVGMVFIYNFRHRAIGCGSISKVKGTGGHFSRSTRL